MNLSDVLWNLANKNSTIISTVDNGRDWFVLSLYLLTTILAIIGNIFVCLVVNNKNLRSTTYALIVNMAISDIIGGLVIPIQWLFCSTLLLDSGKVAQRICGLSKSAQILSYYVSTYSMTAIAIDRFQLICRPHVKAFKPIGPLIVIWFLGTLFTSSTLVAVKVPEFFSPKGVIVCRVLFPVDLSMMLRKGRAMMVMITQYIIPLLLNAIFYGMVVNTVWKRQTIGNVSDDKKKSFNKNKKKTIKMLIIVTVLFAVAWFPTHLMHFLMFYTDVIPVKRKGKCISSTFYMLCYWLGISSCFYNPFIYCYFNKDFQNEAIRYWNCLMPSIKFKFNVNSEEKSIETVSSRNFTEE